eukprot:1161232-Pelagomonas_calceolata.AAC.8
MKRPPACRTPPYHKTLLTLAVTGCTQESKGKQKVVKGKLLAGFRQRCSAAPVVLVLDVRKADLHKKRARWGNTIMEAHPAHVWIIWRSSNILLQGMQQSYGWCYEAMRGVPGF